MKRMTIALVSAAVLSQAALAQTVTLSLTSPQNGATVAAGSTVNWSINYTVSTGNNQGLALLVVDLAQDAANPDLFDLPIASGVPAGMNNFARPAGVTNPGDGNPLLGYRGVARGTVGEKNLLQIGGAQNTFGTARPSGSGVAESATVVGGVGQSGSTLLASGTFSAPSVAGAYTFQLENAVANVIAQLNSPPAITTVAQATTTLAAPSFTINVGGGNPCPADLNNDNTVDISDLTLLLSQFGSVGPGLASDIDNDNDVDISDLTLLLSAFGVPC